jgi:cytochrome c553
MQAAAVRIVKSGGLGSARMMAGTTALTLALTIPGLSFAAGDADRGREVAAVCAPCHGIDGVSPSPAFPILAGQHEIYLANAIRAYQSGERTDAVMGGSVRTLTERQVEDVAAYYASEKGLAVARAERSGPDTAALAAAATAGAEAGALEAGQTDRADQGAARPVAPDGVAGCPVDNPNIPAAQDLDRDGLPDRHDAVPADAGEFVKDSNADGWYEICDIRQLQAIQTLGDGAGNATSLDWATRVGRRYQLVRDLDAAVIAGFQPIGNCGPQNNCMIAGDKFGFTGSFDGGGHVIRKLRISKPEVGGVGLFGVLAKPGSIRGITLDDAEVTGLHGVGALVGANFGLIRDCEGSVRTTGKNATGALVGGHAGKVINCHASGEVTGNDAIGGLIGDMRGFVAHSHASTRVSGHNGVGGLVGLNTFSTLVSSYSTGSVEGNNNVGGLAGINTDAVVADSYSTAAVEGTGTNAGGLVAFNSQSRIRNSYARGEVSGVNSVGGLVGANNGSIRASYATGRVRGQSKAGGLVGDNSGGTVAASYWDVKATGRVFGAGSDDASAAGEGDDNNRLDAGETSQLSAYGKTTQALRALAAPSTGWLPGATVAVGEESAYYCDANADGAVTTDEQRADNLSWDFGTSADLPGVRCIDGGLSAQPLR